MGGVWGGVGCCGGGVGVDVGLVWGWCGGGVGVLPGWCGGDGGYGAVVVGEVWAGIRVVVVLTKEGYGMHFPHPICTMTSC